MEPETEMNSETKGLGDAFAKMTHTCGIDTAAEKIAKWMGWPDCGCSSRQARLNSLYPIGKHRYPKLTIAIPHRDDWYGFHETWHSLVAAIRSAKLEDHIELLVVDQSPGSEHSKNIQQTVNSIASNWQVDPESRVAVNRGGIIDARYESFSEIMGTAAGKMMCFAKARGEWVLCLDSHVILTDESIRKLYDWIKKPANRFSQNLHYGVNLADDHKQYFSHLKIFNEDGTALIGDDGVFGQWRTDPLAAPGKVKPFEVEGGGGWCFFARRGVFMSIGFHPLMRGFGGEEGFLAERFRRAGKKVLSAPFVRGIHRYARLSGDQYFVSVEEKLRNHTIGWKDLGRDLDELRTIWINKPEGSRLPVETVDRVIAQAVVEFQAWMDSKGQVTPENKQPDNIETGSVEDLYSRHCSIVSDINEHLPTLRRIAEECEHVTEFGTRSGVSTSALLAAQPKKLISYDVAAQCACKELKKVSGKTNLVYVHGPEIGNTLTCPVIEETGFLFIDTKHTGDQVFIELDRHAARVRKYIAFHDVVTYGEKGEGYTAENKVTGLMAGINKFLEQHQDEWEQAEWYPNNNGLMVIKRIKAAS
jgi:GT2 family glycosyltransferase